MPELQLLENQGWEQMQQLLDLHMPQEPVAPVVSRPVRRLCYLVAAACILFLFLIPSLLCDSRLTIRGLMPETAVISGVAAINGHTGSNVITAKATTPATHSTGNSVNGSTEPAVTTDYITHAGVTAGNEIAANLYSTMPDSMQYTESIAAQNSALAAAQTPGTAGSLHTALATRLPLLEFKDETPAAEAEKMKMKKQALLSVAFQLKHNLNSGNMHTGNLMYDLPAYPALSASVRLNSKISLSTGVSVFAPGHFNQPVASSETSTPSNNAGIASPLAISSTEQIKQAWYVQVPVTMDLAVRKNLSVSSGAEFAFLHKILIQRNAQVSGVNLVAASSRVTADKSTESKLISPGELKETAAGQQYQIRTSERRFMLSLQYQLSKYTFGLQYSRSLNPSVNLISQPWYNSRNETFSISVGIRLFKK